jgi:endonuclease-3
VIRKAKNPRKGADLKELAHRVVEIIRRLEERYPNPRTALSFSNPLELLVATVLSAQCTDERVNQVTPSLFSKYRTPWDYANADLEKLEEEVRPTGFYRQKARTLQAIGKALVEKFQGRVPGTLEELVSLPGVGRKTANLVLSEAFGIPGIVVDTHVQRVSRRIGLTQEDDPEAIEYDLMEICPREDWSKLSNLLIWHGRKTCVARKPKCGSCDIRELCQYPDKTGSV